MSNVYVYTIFEKEGGRPCCTGIKIGETVRIFDLFRISAKRPLITINKRIESVTSILLKAHHSHNKIIISDFKNHLIPFSLPLVPELYDVYDLHLPTIKSSGSEEIDANNIKTILNKMSKAPLREYHKIIANAGVVYQYLQDSGLHVNYDHVYPVWARETVTGRSRCTGFSIQGYNGHVKVRTGGCSDTTHLLQFDWVSADARVAALLSKDTAALDSFNESDPYQLLADKVGINRESAKLALIRAIYSLDFSAEIQELFPTLCDWINNCKVSAEAGRPLMTMLGRQFKIGNVSTIMSGVISGTLAHAMQMVIRRIWEILPDRLVSDIHDSVIITAKKEEIGALVDLVIPIMARPFAGVLADSPLFPLKINVGVLWQKWDVLLATYRKSGLEYVKKSQRAKSETDQGEGTTTPSSSQEIED